MERMFDSLDNFSMLQKLDDFKVQGFLPHTAMAQGVRARARVLGKSINSLLVGEVAMGRQEEGG